MDKIGGTKPEAVDVIAGNDVTDLELMQQYVKAAGLILAHFERRAFQG